MKLLMISGDRSLADGKQGAFWYTLEGLKEHCDRIDVITPRGTVAHAASFDVFPNVFVHPSPWGLFRHPGWILRKGRELHATHRHDVMTVQEYPPFYNGRGAIKLHRATGMPFVIEVHHIAGVPKARSMRDAAERFLSKIMLPIEAKKAAAVRVVSGQTLETLKQWGIAEKKLHLVPSFYIDKDVFRPAEAKKTVDIVFSGRLVPDKGLGRLLRVVAKLPDRRLLVIGDGPARQTLEHDAKKLGIGSRVRFAGWLPTNVDVADAMRSAKILVVASGSEGGPRVALEAMAAGVPVASTPVGVMPDVIRHGENGFLWEKEDALLSILRSFFTDEAAQRSITHAAPKAVERFDRATVLPAYAAFLQSIR